MFLMTKCKPLFYNFPYLLEEEQVYEPPLDDDLDKSGLELGLDALNKMPRAAAISAATAFSGLSERLKAYLRPFSARREVVSKEVIGDFFRSERERNSAE
jgi:E3 ubiquitin-protein ligase UBR7